MSTQEAIANPNARAASGRPKGPVIRYVWITLGTVVLSQGSIVALQWFFIPSQVRTPRSPVCELPETLGRWRGRDAAADPGTVGADDVINRAYTSADGTVV